MTLRVLTGITTTGTLHLGNYVGAVRRAIAATAIAPALFVLLRPLAAALLFAFWIV